MNDNDPILAELRKISAWADVQRRVTKWSLICVAIFIPLAIIFALVMEKRVDAHLEGIASEQPPGWYDVRRDVRMGDFDKAISIGEKLVQKTPQDPEAHRDLADVYLAAGKLEKARESYAEAVRLFPSEENQKLLSAIKRRISAENPQPEGGANGSQPIRSETSPTSSAAGSRRSP